jgi:hypothetical protein
MKRVLGVVAVCLGFSGGAMAQQHPLEAAAAAQVRPQAPDAQLAAPFFHGMGKKTDWQVMLEAGKCYWFSGVAGVEGKKLALYLWSPDGKRVTDSRQPVTAATMAHCAMVSGMYKMEAKTEKETESVVGIYAKQGSMAVVAPTPKVEEPKIDIGAICDKAAATAAPGARRQGEFFDGKGGSIGHDDRQDYSIAMDAGKCYWVVGCGEPGHVKALSLYLWGPNNKRITEAKPDSPNAMVGHCAQQTGMFKIQSKVSGGSGEYKVAVYAK